MLVKMGESRQLTIPSGTYDGVNVNCILEAAAVNTRIGISDFDPQQINVKVMLKRNGRSYVMMQDNLLILGHHNTIIKGGYEFMTGLDLIAPAAAVKHNLMRSVRLNFGGPIRVGASDILLVEFSLAKSGLFTANVNAGNSYLEFDVNSCVGYEVGIFRTISQVVQANTTKESFNLGNNVTDISFLNFNKNGFENPVITNLNLSSDKLDLSLNYQQVLARHSMMFANIPNMRYGSALPIHPTDATGRVFRGSDYLPQSIVIHSGAIESELDEVKLDISFNSADVAASANFLVWNQYETSTEILQEAQARQDKHLKENISKLPATL